MSAGSRIYRVRRAVVRMPQETQIAAIIAMRQRFPRFGPKKIRARTDDGSPPDHLARASTIGDILKRHGLIEAKRRRRRPVAQGEIVCGAHEPNGEWAIDFKGWFRTSDGRRCDP